ncbi:plasmid mobilization protein [Sporofaciens sp. SGI.106]|uniref:plasmid mobilization protein n=1 Tax=Sporofaciens sp. SGI.106 TaxID=3420568 RepID=UPI003D0728FD
MPRAKKNMTSLLDSFESDTEKEHDAAVTAASKTPKKTVGGDTRATALVSMTVDEKERLTTKAKAHGLSLSAFFRLAADEYMNNHNW